MTSINPAADQAASEAPRDHPRPDLVTVTLNGVGKEIKRGEYTGRNLKLALGVPVEYELDQVVGGEFKPIANDDRVHVRGGETYVSHVGQGQSS
jgi:hypothetical protein